MSMWAVYIASNGDQHVMPCDGHGEITNEHCLTLGCWCSPRYEFLGEFGEHIQVSHKDPERGGCNA